MLTYIRQLFRKRRWPEPNIAQVRSRSRVLVIDDQDFAYESLFRRDGYNLTKWDDVEDLEKIESGEFEVILLDIQGVGKAISKRQGLGVLEHIRAKNPAQILIAYSGDDYKLDKQSFFDKADAKLGKSQDYLEYKRCVDEQIKKAHSIHHYLDLLIKVFGDEVDPDKLKKASKRAILSRDPRPLINLLDRHEVQSSQKDAALRILYSAISILKSSGASA